MGAGINYLVTFYWALEEFLIGKLIISRFPKWVNNFDMFYSFSGLDSAKIGSLNNLIIGILS